MAIKHSPGCGCCVAGATGCCLDTALKDLPTVSYDPLTSTYTFSETQWYYTDSRTLPAMSLLTELLLQTYFLLEALFKQSSTFVA
jgi:hypothetical protein